MTLQNRYLKLEVGPLPMSLLDSLVVLPDLFLQLGSPSVEIPRADLPETVHIVGVLPPFTKGVLPKQIQPFLESGKPIIAVTQGTLANHELDQVLQPTLDALAERDNLLVIGTTGGRPVSHSNVRFRRMQWCSPIYLGMKCLSMPLPL